MGDGNRKEVVAQLSYRHHAIIDRMLAFPHKSKQEIGMELGYTPAWFSQLINSDAFQAEYTRRLADWQADIQRGLSARLAEQANAASNVVMHELERMTEDEEGNQVPAADPRFALDAQHNVLKALGFVGGKSGSAVNVNIDNRNQVASVDSATLEAARSKMRLMQNGAAEDTDK